MTQNVLVDKGNLTIIFLLLVACLAIDGGERDLSILGVKDKRRDRPLLLVLVPGSLLSHFVELVLVQHYLYQALRKLHVFFLEADDVHQLLLRL